MEDKLFTILERLQCIIHLLTIHQLINSGELIILQPMEAVQTMIMDKEEQECLLGIIDQVANIKVSLELLEMTIG
jgi:hypothetical protein